jgi:hypothetical protein
MRAASALRCIAVATLTAACAPGLPVAGALDAARVASTVEQLNAGRALYVAKCTGCHSAHPPSNFAATEWPAHVADMSADAKLQPNEETAITRYLVTFARR